MMRLHIETLSGFCPVQAEGTINGKPFYFRARGRRWSMGIGNDPVGIGAVIENAPADEWYCECTWGTERFAAGWMPEDEARRLIVWCAQEYVRNAARGAPAPADPSQGSDTTEPQSAAPEANAGDLEDAP